MTIVQAIANATLLDDVPVPEARTAFNARMASLSSAHDVLMSTGWMTAKLTAVIQGVLAPYRGRRVRSRGPELELAPKPALAFALALHELGTNAAKYGALSTDRGYVEIAWTLKPTSAGRELKLRWHERNGPAVKKPTREGFGSRLIRKNLASEFNGTVDLDFRSDGLSCTICAPAEGLSRAEPRACMTALRVVRQNSRYT